MNQYAFWFLESSASVIEASYRNLYNVFSGTNTYKLKESSDPIPHLFYSSLAPSDVLSVEGKDPVSTAYILWLHRRWWSRMTVLLRTTFFLNKIIAPLTNLSLPLEVKRWDVTRAKMIFEKKKLSIKIRRDSMYQYLCMHINCIENIFPLSSLTTKHCDAYVSFKSEFNS